MKKMLTVLVIMVAFMTMTSVVAFAGDGCAAAKTAKTETAEKTKAATTCASKAEVTQAVAKTGCAGHTEAEHAAHKAECTAHKGGDCKSIALSIDGMVCQGCEGSIKAALAKVPGVLHVEKISHTDGKAVVCIDPDKVKDADLVTAVTNKGYKAEVVPAMAAAATPVKAGCSPSCPNAQKAAATGEKTSCGDKK